MAQTTMILLALGLPAVAKDEAACNRMVRRRLRSKWSAVRVVLSVCTLCLLSSLSITWVQIYVFQARTAERAYWQEVNLRMQLCHDAFPNNSSKLFFKSCRVDLKPLLHSGYRLGLPSNFTCQQVPQTHLSETTHLSGTTQLAGSTLVNKTTRMNGTISLSETAHFSGSSTQSEQDVSDSRRFNDTCKRHGIVPGSAPVPSVPFGHPCLKRFIDDNCYDGLPVPRVVHYVWFSSHTMDIFTFLSVLAAYRFLDPCLILFHVDSVPLGPYWRALLSLVPVLLVVQRSAPTTIFGKTLGAVQHKSDIARLEALKEYGGIYLDGDQIVLKDMKEFREKEFVMGHENVHNLANSLLVSAPKAKFIDIWYKNYRSYNPNQWGIHSTFLPLALARIFPKMIHNAGYAFIKPDLPGILEVWNGHYNWTSNYAVHLYYRSMIQMKLTRTQYTLEELLALTSSLGEIARHIVFGSKNVCLTGG